MTSKNDSVQPAGLRQAAYVMERLVTGKSKDQIVRTLYVDEQLVTMRISFLKHNHGIAETKEGWWSATAKGIAWSRKTNGR